MYLYGIPRFSSKGRGVCFQNLRNVTKKLITEIFVASSLLSKLSRLLGIKREAPLNLLKTQYNQESAESLYKFKDTY